MYIKTNEWLFEVRMLSCSFVGVQGHSVGAVLRPQQRLRGRGGGRGRPRLRVHDGRHRTRARPHRTELRSRHER